MKRLTTKEFIKKLNLIKPNIEVIGGYKNQRTKIQVKCKDCGHEWLANPSDLLSGHGCPKCRYTNNSKRSRMSHEIFIERLSKINPHIIVLDQYITSQQKLTVKCELCQYTWMVKPNTLLNGIGCANCAGLKKKTTSEFVENLRKINPAIDVLGEYSGNRACIKVKCQLCGHIWSPTGKALLNGRGCPQCSKAGTSFMEQFILAACKKMLGDDAVFSRDRDTLGIELDIYIPSKALAIEPGSWFWHENTLERDIEKRSRAKGKGIRVITIYDTFPIEEDVPFSEDCYVFEGQLNEPGFFRLKELTTKILKIIDKNFSPLEEFWDEVIENAHKGASRLSHEEFVKTIGAITPTIRIIGRYTANKAPISVKCTVCGYEWSTTPTMLLKGVGCISCAGLKKKTTEEFIEQMANISPSIEVQGEYINTNTKLKIRNKDCGHSWYATPNSLLRGSNCPKCAGNTKKTHLQFVEEFRTANPYVSVVGEYVDAKTKIVVRCNTCGKELFMTPNALLNGHGCSVCNHVRGMAKRQGKTHLKTTEEVIQQLLVINPQIEVLGEYTRSKEPMQVRCKVCGHEWSPQAGSLLRGHGCPECAKQKRKKKDT